jgi:hypothetical protein
LPADAHALTAMTIRDLGEAIQETLGQDRGKRLDAFNRAHQMDSEKKIAQALEAVYNIRR